MSKFLLYSEENYEYILQPAGKVVLALFILLIFFLGIFLFRKKEAKQITTKQLSFSGIALALALVASYIKLTSLPFGGSITLFSMFFICFIGYVYGPKVGITIAVSYGFMQLLLEPYIYAPLQVILDYPLAFGMLGLCGFFANSKHGFLKGYLLGVFGRYLCHVISGYLFFAEYAPDGVNPLVYTLLYNATYIVPETIITVILLLLPVMVKAIQQVKVMATTTDH